jgi:hypothetical protein
MYGMREVERLGEKAAKAKASRKQAGRWKTGSKSQGREARVGGLTGDDKRRKTSAPRAGSYS